MVFCPYSKGTPMISLPDVRGRSGRILVLPVVSALVLAIPLATPVMAEKATPPPPVKAFDYTQVKGLSADIYAPDQIVKEIIEVPMFDGIDLHIEVTRPDVAGRFPVILESSPYHGTLADREGTRILPEPRDPEFKSIGLTGYFAPKGYAVVMMDLRGTGQSQGCLDHIGPKDLKDLKTVVEWAAGQTWSNGRVGMTGHSYVGSTPSAAAAMAPHGLVTIVPSAGLATMYDHQFQEGVPYFLQWAGPMAAYEQLTFERYLDDSFGKNLEYVGCGLPTSSLTAGETQLSGAYVAWHAERDWREDATAADIPIFMVHGVNDNAARVAAMEWFTDRGGRSGDKIWLGQWDHGSGCCPTRRGIQWTYALHAWFDKHLAQRRVDTGPAAELFLSDGTFEGARTGDRTQIHLDDQWPPSSRQMLTLYPTADKRLSTSAPVLPGSAAFSGDPRGFTSPQDTGGVDFATAPMTADLLLAGQPLLDVVASFTASRVHLIGTLYDESPPDAQGDTPRRRISQFAINPELRLGASTPAPVVPTVFYEMSPPGFAMAHNLRAGHKLVLRFTTSDPDKVPTFAVDPRITIATGPGATALRVPVVTKPALVADDVPLNLRPKKAGPAQRELKASVTPPAGAPVRTPDEVPLTVANYEFDVLEGFDNAGLFVSAVPSMPADIDLYLQKRKPDGTWGDDLAFGGIFDLTVESFGVSRPPPGHYRIQVHNFAGAPGTRVDLTLTFTNSDGVPGPSPG